MDAPERQKRLFLVDVHHSVYVMARTPSEAAKALREKERWPYLNMVDLTRALDALNVKPNSRGV